MGEAEGGPSTNHSHLPRASGQLPNISLPPSFPLRFSSSLWLLPHFSFLLLLLSAFLGWIRLLVLKTLGAQHSLPATSIPLEPDHPFHLFFLTWRTSCQTILVNPCFWAFDDYRKGLVSFFLSPWPQLDCFGTPADCHTPGANGKIIIKDTRHCIVVFMLGRHRSRYEISPRLISTLWNCFDDPSRFATPPPITTHIFRTPTNFDFYF